MFLSNIFDNLQMSMTGAAFDAAQTALHYRKRGDGRLQFVPSASNQSMWVRAGIRIGSQLAFATASQWYPMHLRRKAQQRMREGTAKQRDEMVKVISNGHKANEEMHNPQGVVLKYRGEQANEGLLLWIAGKNRNTFQFHTYWDQRIKGLGGFSSGNNSGKSVNGTLLQEDTKVEVMGTCAFMDLGAEVTSHSSKNVILTKVQGRDYSRKELISNGDLDFTVKGSIVSNFPDVYPYEEVSKFLTLMQHKGVIQVYNLMFQQYNVTQILIKDFSMSQRIGFKNVQPYSFTCVAVEPDKEVEIVEDTLGAMDVEIQANKKEGWGKQLLDKVKSTAADQAVLLMDDLTAGTI